MNYIFHIYCSPARDNMELKTERMVVENVGCVIGRGFDSVSRTIINVGRVG